MILRLPAILLALAGFTLSGALAQAAAPVSEVRLDYAYYSPLSLILKKFGWLEQDLQASHVGVRWVLSQGSNRALEFLGSNSVDFGSTAGLAAVLGRANGNPIKAVYVYSQPEWTALVVPKDSPIHTLADLKGKRVAATKGTDPYLFLLRSLHTVGLKRADIELVALQHADGRTALEQGRVDAWAGLDPLMAGAELNSGAHLLYRNIAFNTYGFLNTTETFAREHPELVRTVLADYEKARHWVLTHPDEAAAILAEQASIPLPVARLQLTRTHFDQPVPGAEHINALKSAAPILLEEELVRPGTDVNKVIDTLVEPGFARVATR
jgi:sulfonate transport system substrate-binding protein